MTKSPAPKPPPAPLDWGAFTKFVGEFKDESDRAAVILGAAKLDVLLSQLLDKFLLPSTASTDELLEGDSPLSTFSARINICYRLGLISAQFAKSLHLVRRIRNSFAHELSGCSLDSGSHSDRLKSLLAPLRSLPFFITFRDHYFEEATPSSEFKACISLMAARLEARVSNTEQTPDDEAWNFTQTSWANEKASQEDAPDGEV